MIIHFIVCGLPPLVGKNLIGRPPVLRVQLHESSDELLIRLANLLLRDVPKRLHLVTRILHHLDNRRDHVVDGNLRMLGREGSRELELALRNLEVELELGSHSLGASLTEQ